MAVAYKVLGQAAPGATTNVDVYTVPAATEAIISSIVVCNRGAAGTYRIAVRPNGAALSNQHYIAFDAAATANEIAGLSLGVTVDAGDVITVYGSSANFSFSVFGSEVTA